MNKPLRVLSLAAFVAATATSLSQPAWADPPQERERHGARDNRPQDRERRNDEKHAHKRYGEREQYQRRPMAELRFSVDDRRFIHDYYGYQWQKGRCPPGLAKKNNGCLPLGQAKQWRMGYPLPMDLRRYPLPPEVMVRLPIPPAGHEFVRVASDILLIAVGTGMVVDAIEDLGR